MTQQEDRAFAEPLMDPFGPRRDEVPNVVWIEAYAAGDGIGATTPGEVRAGDDGYDMRHVLGSSPEGWSAIAGVLRRHGLS